MSEGLDDILNSSDPGDESPIVEPKSELHEASPILDVPRDENGRFAPKDKGEEVTETVAATETAPPAAEPNHVPITALQDERRKRQELEQQLRFYQQQAQQPPQPQEPTDFWEDPNAVISNQVNQAVNSALQQWEARQMQDRAERAEAAARAQYPDYDAAFEKFREQVQFDPSLVQQLRTAENPAEFAYQRGKAAIDVADPEAYRAKIESEVRAKIEAELLAQAPRPMSLPTTTAGQRSVGDRSGPAWAGPQSLNNILGR